MLKIDANAATYAERFAVLTDSDVDNEPYLQIMLAEGVNTDIDDDGDSVIDVDTGIFFSFRVDSSRVPKACPDYTNPFLIWNIDGGGGDRTGVAIDNDYTLYVNTLINECEALGANAPIPVSYRTISFDEALVDFDT